MALQNTKDLYEAAKFFPDTKPFLVWSNRDCCIIHAEILSPGWLPELIWMSHIFLKLCQQQLIVTQPNLIGQDMSCVWWKWGRPFWTGSSVLTLNLAGIHVDTQLSWLPTSPAVSLQISGPVVCLCTVALAGFSNCWRIYESSVLAAISSALATAPRIACNEFVWMSTINRMGGWHSVLWDYSVSSVVITSVWGLKLLKFSSGNLNSFQRFAALLSNSILCASQDRWCFCMYCYWQYLGR